MTYNTRIYNYSNLKSEDKQIVQAQLLMFETVEDTITEYMYRRESSTNILDAVSYEEGITVGELAEKLGQTPANVIKVLFLLGTMVTINSALNDEQVELICLEYGCECEKHIPVDEINFENIEVVDDEKDLQPRCPVVTIMDGIRSFT